MYIVSAVQCRDMWSIFTLIDHGADVNISNKFGETVLHWTLKHKKYDIFAALHRRPPPSHLMPEGEKWYSYNHRGVREKTAGHIYLISSESLLPLVVLLV